MSEGALSLPRFLRARRAAVLASWLKRVEVALSDPELTRAELKDHMPDFLDGLAAALAPGDTPAGAVARPGGAHGAQRFRVGFDLREVVNEYGMLVDVVLELAHAEQVEVSFAEVRELFAVVNRGVAEAVAAFAAERQQTERRQAANHVAFISHELRNPLGGASLSLELLQTVIVDEKQKRFASLVRKNLDRMRDLIHQVLTVERLAAGAELVLEKVRVESVVSRVVEEAAGVAALSRNVELRIDLEPDLEVVADARLFESILANLLQNGVKFSESGGRVELRARRDGGRLVVEVEDSCGGLEGSPADLFRPFVQASSEAGKRGFGLGLAIVRQAVDAHGGEISVRNGPGPGCTFVVSLPTPPPSRH
jgi:signal transduction histidine kinase